MGVESFRGLVFSFDVQIKPYRQRFSNGFQLDFVQISLNGKACVSRVLAQNLATRLMRNVNPLYDTIPSRIELFGNMLKYLCVYFNQLDCIKDVLHQTTETLTLNQPDLASHIQAQNPPYFQTSWRQRNSNEFPLFDNLPWTRVFTFERSASDTNTPIYLTQEYARLVLEELSRKPKPHMPQEEMIEAFVVCSMKNSQILDCATNIIKTL